MHQITTHHDFDAPAALLWELLADFAHIERWWPKDIPAVQIERVEVGRLENLKALADDVELEGEGIGLTRHIYNKGFAAPVSERLDFRIRQPLPTSCPSSASARSGLPPTRPPAASSPCPKGAAASTTPANSPPNPASPRRPRPFCAWPTT